MILRSVHPYAGVTLLKLRVIPILFIKNGFIVRSEGFNYHQNIGNFKDQADRFNQWDCDELMFIDISRDKHYDIRRDDMNVKTLGSMVDIISEVSKISFTPLTCGGGIRMLSDAESFIRNGADKITVNTGAYIRPGLIREIANKLGSQCVTVSIDYRVIDDSPVVFVSNGTLNTGMSIFNWINVCEERGAGEFLLNCIDRDGKANGFDCKTIEAAIQSTSVPVIACGGAGDEVDFLDLASKTSVSGMAAGNYFHFTEQSYPRLKKFLVKKGVNVRP